MWRKNCYGTFTLRKIFGQIFLLPHIDHKSSAISTQMIYGTYNTNVQYVPPLGAFRYADLLTKVRERNHIIVSLS